MFLPPHLHKLLCRIGLSVPESLALSNIVQLGVSVLIRVYGQTQFCGWRLIEALDSECC